MKDTKKNILILLVGGLLIFGSIYVTVKNDNATSQSNNNSYSTVELGGLTFQTDPGYALERAQSEKKMIYIYVHSAICSACKEFETGSLSDERIIHILNDNFILISVDTAKQRSLAANLGIRWTPTSIFTTPEGQEIPGARTLYKDQDSFYGHLNELINNEE